jgi:hypothetical protein
MSARRNPAFLTNRSFPPTVSETFSNVVEWKNNVNVVRATLPCINLEGKDPAANKPNWIRVESREGSILNIIWFRSSLPKFGDVEIHSVNDRVVLLACGGWATARAVWASLEEEGYKLSAEEFPSESGQGWSEPFLLGTGLLLGTLGLFYLIKRV